MPSIKFIGKRSLIKSPAKAAASHNAPVSTNQVVIEGNGEDFRSMDGGAWFGRPQLTDREMEAIESGGATEI